MGNLEAALSQATANDAAIFHKSQTGEAPEFSQEANHSAKSDVGIDLHSNNSNNPIVHHQTAATSVPVSVPEVESETDVGVPSPSPEERCIWGSFSQPDETEVQCPTPYHSTSVEPDSLGGENYNLFGNEHLACFGDAVGRALAPDGDPSETSACAPQCPHLAAAALHRQRNIPPSLLALNELIKDSMGGPPVPGLHLNSPCDSPRWAVVPGPPRGSPVAGVSERGSFLATKNELEEAMRLQSKMFSSPDSTREVSEEVLTRSGNKLRDTESETEKKPFRDPFDARSKNIHKEQKDDLVRFCCAHIVSMHGRIGANSRNANSSNNSNAIDCPVQALQQLSPRLHECSEAISRSLLLQPTPVGASAVGPSATPVGLPLGSLSSPHTLSLSDASLGEVSSTLKRLQASIDQFTSVLSRCEGRLLSVLYGMPSMGTSLPLGAFSGTARGGTTGALEFGDGTVKSSGAHSSSDTTRAQPGSPVGPKESDEEGSLTPIFFPNREITTPTFNIRVKNNPPVPVGVPLSEMIRLQQQQSSLNIGDCFSSLAGEGPSRGPSKSLSEALSADPSSGSIKDTGTSRTERRGPGRAIRWAKERLKGIMAKNTKQTANSL